MKFRVLFCVILSSSNQPYFRPRFILRDVKNNDTLSEVCN